VRNPDIVTPKVCGILTLAYLWLIHLLERVYDVSPLPEKEKVVQTTFFGVSISDTFWWMQSVKITARNCSERPELFVCAVFQDGRILSESVNVPLAQILLKYLSNSIYACS